MSGYSAVDYHDVEPKADAMHFLRDPLDCENLGVTVVDADSDWEGRAHEHADSEHEEVYLLVDGEATVRVGEGEDEEDIPLESGDAVRVDPGTTRSLSIGDGGTVVIAGAP